MKMAALRDFIERIQKTFRIEKLNEFQHQGLEALLDKRDVFVGTKTGSGKTIIYESMGVVSKEMVTVVIAPLQSIMEEPIERLTNLGLSALYVNEVIAGKYQFEYSCRHYEMEGCISPPCTFEEAWSDCCRRSPYYFAVVRQLDVCIFIKF
jgi:superfamily II DNA or RNA helicase